MGSEDMVSSINVTCRKVIFGDNLSNSVKGTGVDTCCPSGPGKFPGCDELDIQPPSHTVPTGHPSF